MQMRNEPFGYLMEATLNLSHLAAFLHPLFDGTHSRVVRISKANQSKQLKQQAVNAWRVAY